MNMTDGLLVELDEHQVLETTLSIPYTLTTGRAAGTFLAELHNRRILGSRCSQTGKVSVPPKDYCCDQDGDAAADFVQLSGSGVVTSWTRTNAGVVALMRLDGADNDLLHRMVGELGELQNGARVTPRWADADEGFLTLAGFELTPADQPGDEPQPVSELAEPVQELAYRLDLDYRHAYGQAYGRMFDELASRQRIIGSLCPKCRNVLVPARGNCDACFVATAQFVDVADTGVLAAFSVIHLEFVGQTGKPPYVYAEVVLDGSATRVIHTVGGFDMSQAERILSIGMRVQAVWSDGSASRGTLEDIQYFAPLELH
jgi:uncharacterized OB-fold protein